MTQTLCSTRLISSLVLATALALGFSACKKEETVVVAPVVVAAAAVPEAKPPEPAPADAAPAAADADFVRVVANHNPTKPGDPVIINVGSFKIVESKFDPAKLGEAMATIELDLNAIASNAAKRDEHLRTSDYLDTAKFGMATVKITDVKNKAGSIYTGKAEVTARGITATMPVEFDVQTTADGKVTAKGEHSFKRSDFQIGKPEGKDEGTADALKLQFQLTLQAAS